MNEQDWIELCGRLSSEVKAVQRRATDEATALAQSDADVERRLHVVVESGDGTPFALRWGAVFALSRRERIPPHSIETLFEALGRDDGDLRWAAADLVKQLAVSGTNVNDRLEDLAERGSAAQRKMALYCLRDLDVRSDGTRRAVDAALGAPESEVRLAALSALLRLCPDRAAAARRIVDLLSDANAGVRRAAAASLGTLGDLSEEVLHALRNAAASDDDSLRRAAERSLQRLGDAPGGG